MNLRVISVGTEEEVWRDQILDYLALSSWKSGDRLRITSEGGTLKRRVGDDLDEALADLQFPPQYVRQTNQNRTQWRNQ